MSKPILLGVDAGGTFTDFVAVEFGSPVSLKVYKTLSTPEAPEQAIMNGIAGMGLLSAMQRGDLQIVHGSTVATNAALEGMGARTVFITNYGFADMLQLARQTRPKLYQLEFPPIKAPVPAELCLETGGRVAADGTVLEPLSEEEVQRLAEQVEALKPEAVAINLLFSFLDDRFEKAISDAIQARCPQCFISRSSLVLPEYKEYERGIATWLNASLGPVVHRYLGQLASQLRPSSLQIMQSSGETISAEQAAQSAVHLLLSGPAGGLTAIEFLAKQISKKKIISFDMGGTSTDVALLDGRITRSSEGRIADYPVAVSMVDMHTIGAGGGSIAFVDEGGMLQVGPRSAGASPGPACYDRGGTDATVTDANLLLGRLTPAIALADGLVLRRDLAELVIEKLASHLSMKAIDVAHGIIEIANEHMAKAIRLISVNRGYHTEEFVLASFGGAGGLHVCALAEAMLMTEAIVPVHSGVLSALGMVVAKQGRQFSKTIARDEATRSDAEMAAEFEALETRGRGELEAQGLQSAQLQYRRSVDMRYRGQSYTLSVDWQNREMSIDAFRQQHEKRYGYCHQADTEIVNLRVAIWAQSRGFELPTHDANSCNKLHDIKVSEDGQGLTIHRRESLEVGDWLPGPAIISEYSSTVFVAEHWKATADKLGNIHLCKSAGEPTRA